MKILEFTLPEDRSQQEIDHMKEIFIALIKSGGLFGVKGGKTVIHFDSVGTFMSVQLDYYPWRRRKE